MSRYLLGGLALVSLLFLNEVAVAEEKEVALPTLPAGAGAPDKDAPKSFTATPSGLKYRVLRKGAGAAPKATNTVKVHYHGWLDNGKKFDSSYERKEPISFGLNQVIKGWTEGMQLVGTGGMIELEIPAELGYGARGAGRDVPPNATLHFLVELLEVQ
jgi:FKBP-type peptidyl-prolyl cis-trans isomerase FkpA